MTIRAEIQSLAPSALLDFFILDSTNLPGGSLMRFHAGTNGLMQPVVWQGQTYEPLPIEAEGFDVTTKGSLPRPKMRIANVNGLLSASVKSFNDFVGCKVTRKRTFAKYLDAVNFPLRRNLLAYTDSLPEIAGGWVHGDALTVTPNVPGPRGTDVATRFEGLSGTTISSTGTTVYKSFSVVIGNNYMISTMVNPVTSGSFVIRYGATADAQTRSFPMTGGTGWRRVTAVFTANAAGGTTSNCTFGCSTPGGMTVELSEAQAEVGAIETDYQAILDTYNANPTADPNQFIPDDLWFVERKLTENRYIIEFELSSAFDLMGQQLPNRQVIQNSCSWKYRSTECGWTGVNYDVNNAPSTPANDVCAKTLAACRVRFGVQPIRFGGFPGAVRGTT